MNVISLKTPIVKDNFTEFANKMFDVPVADFSETQIIDNLDVPENFNIGLIYGPSGSGKSTILKKFGQTSQNSWSDLPIISNFNQITTPESAAEILSSVGLSSIPSWLRPFHCLSNGEQFRANLALTIAQNNDLAIIDEFTSVVDRNVAKSASNALQKYVRKNNKKIVLASCHSDIIEWLQPDWIYNPTEGITHLMPRGSLQRPQISLKIFRAKYEAWQLFKHHHYLSADLNKAAKCFMVMWNDNPVALTAILSFPHAKLKNAWRESRTVVLPDYQGLGIGVRISDYFGSIIKSNNGKYYSRTTHPAMIAYRNKSDKWRVTSKGKMSKMGNSSTKSSTWRQDDRLCYSFEYIGQPSTEEEGKLFWEKC